MFGEDDCATGSGFWAGGPATSKRERDAFDIGGNIGWDRSQKTHAAPRIRETNVDVDGRLPPEVIQRIVRQTFGRFRLCYESGLRENPKLRGRVVVRFVIDESGAVASARDQGSDLGDHVVVDCIVRSFQTLSFPEPMTKKNVTVTYSIDLAPA